VRVSRVGAEGGLKVLRDGGEALAEKDFVLLGLSGLTGLENGCEGNEDGTYLVELVERLVDAVAFEAGAALQSFNVATLRDGRFYGGAMLVDDRIPAGEGFLEAHGVSCPMYGLSDAGEGLTLADRAFMAW
jgi:hypothetical protein